MRCIAVIYRANSSCSLSKLKADRGLLKATLER